MNIENLIAANALYRPGPMDYIPDYISGLNEGQIKYDCPALESILKPTYGVIVYQEQVMQIVRDLAGYSWGRSDIVRRAMSKKHQDEIDAERKFFVYGGKYETKTGETVVIPGCIKNKICKTDEESERVANAIYDKMVNFAKYAFNKSHAACYAITAYRTGFLKCFFPAEYFTSVLNWAEDIEEIAKIIVDAKENGVDIIPPDINLSQAKFSLSDENIVYGIGLVKGIGSFGDEIIAERDKGGPFTSLKNYLLRMGKSKFDSLVKAGCFDSFGYQRNQLKPVTEGDYTNWIADLIDLVEKYKDEEKTLEKLKLLKNFVDEYEDFEQLKERCKEEGFTCPLNKTKTYPSKDSILKKIAAKEQKILQLLQDINDIPEYEADAPESLSEKLAEEREVLGLYLSGHPIDEFQVNTPKIEDIDEKETSVSGIIEELSVRKDRNGNEYASFSLTDKTGQISCIIFSSNYQAAKNYIYAGSAVCLTGVIKVDDFKSDEDNTFYQIKVDSVNPLAKSKHIYRMYVANMEDWLSKREAVNAFLAENGSTLQVMFEHEGICREIKNTVSDGIIKIAERIQ